MMEFYIVFTSAVLLGLLLAAAGGWEDAMYRFALLGWLLVAAPVAAAAAVYGVMGRPPYTPGREGVAFLLLTVVWVAVAAIGAIAYHWWTERRRFRRRPFQRRLGGR